MKTTIIRALAVICGTLFLSASAVCGQSAEKERGTLPFGYLEGMVQVVGFFYDQSELPQFSTVMAGPNQVWNLQQVILVTDTAASGSEEEHIITNFGNLDEYQLTLPKGVLVKRASVVINGLKMAALFLDTDDAGTISERRDYTVKGEDPENVALRVYMGNVSKALIKYYNPWDRIVLQQAIQALRGASGNDPIAP